MNSGGFFPALPVLSYKLSFFIVNSTSETKKKDFFSHLGRLKKLRRQIMLSRMKEKREIIIAAPHGVCAGVRRALEAVESVLHRCGIPVYVLHEIVHNDFIVNNLRSRGVHFAETLDEVPEGAVLLFSAHGVSAAVEQEARNRKLRIVDATCPLVKRLQVAAAQRSGPGDLLILIGHRGHPEVEGVLGRTGPGMLHVVENEADIAALPDDSGARRISRLAQTTFNCETVETITEALRRRYPALECGPGICYATTNRQNAVRELASHCGMMLIIGSQRSSNSNRLREIAASCGCRAFLIDGPEALPPEVFSWWGAIGVSAGASAPEELVERTVTRLEELGFGPVRLLGEPEQKLEFAPPGMLEG